MFPSTMCYRLAGGQGCGAEAAMQRSQHVNASTCGEGTGALGAALLGGGNATAAAGAFAFAGGGNRTSL
jgi:hypothetical protein